MLWYGYFILANKVYRSYWNTIGECSPLLIVFGVEVPSADFLWSAEGKQCENYGLSN